MATVLKSSELRHLNLAQREKLFIHCLNSAGSLDMGERIGELRNEIKRLEEKFSMSTGEMLQSLCTGDLPDDGEYAEWRKKYMTLRVHEANVQKI